MINKGASALAAESLSELAHQLEDFALLALAADESRISATQFRTLEVLGRLTPTKAKLLADEAGMMPSTISRVCDRLLALGLITREANPDSRREVLVRITTSGSEVVKRVSERRLADWANILHRVPAQSRRPVAEAVTMLTKAASRYRSETTARG